MSRQVTLIIRPQALSLRLGTMFWRPTGLTVAREVILTTVVSGLLQEFEKERKGSDQPSDVRPGVEDCRIQILGDW